MKMRVFFLSVLILVFCNIIFAGGIVKVNHLGSDESQIGTSTMYVQNDMLRMESNMEGVETIMIFDAAKEIMYNINVSEKNYMMLTKEDFKKVGKKMNDAMKQLEEQMKHLPKEQQEMMKKMMEGNMANLGQEEEPVEKTEYEKVKSGIYVNGFECDKYIGKSAGVKVEETWVTDWENAGLGNEYISAFEKLKSFFSELVEQMGPLAQKMTDGMDGWLIEKGVPIKTISYNNGAIESTLLVEEIKDEVIDNSLFKIPSDYTKDNPFDQF